MNLAKFMSDFLFSILTTSASSHTAIFSVSLVPCPFLVLNWMMNVEGRTLPVVCLCFFCYTQNTLSIPILTKGLLCYHFQKQLESHKKVSIIFVFWDVQVENDIPLQTQSDIYEWFHTGQWFLLYLIVKWLQAFVFLQGIWWRRLWWIWHWLCHHAKLWWIWVIKIRLLVPFFLKIALIMPQQSFVLLFIVKKRMCF